MPLSYNLIDSNLCISRYINLDIENKIPGFIYEFAPCTKTMKFQSNGTETIQYDPFIQGRKYLKEIDRTDLIKIVERCDDDGYYYDEELFVIPSYEKFEEEILEFEVIFPKHWLRIKGSNIYLFVEYNNKIYLCESLPNTSSGRWCLNLDHTRDHYLVYNKLFNGLSNEDYFYKSHFRFYVDILAEEEKTWEVINEDQLNLEYSPKLYNPSYFHSGSKLSDEIKTIEIDSPELEITKINNSLDFNPRIFSNLIETINPEFSV